MLVWLNPEQTKTRSSTADNNPLWKPLFLQGNCWLFKITWHSPFLPHCCVQFAVVAAHYQQVSKMYTLTIPLSQCVENLFLLFLFCIENFFVCVLLQFLHFCIKFSLQFSTCIMSSAALITKHVISHLFPSLSSHLRRSCVYFTLIVPNKLSTGIT